MSLDGPCQPSLSSQESSSDTGQSFILGISNNSVRRTMIPIFRRCFPSWFEEAAWPHVGHGINGAEANTAPR
jgi:hypothetical protein